MAISLTSEMLRMALAVTWPLFVVILGVGLLISILQVVTQIQDPSVAFVPKMLAFGAVLLLLAPWMIGKLTGFGVAMFSRLAQ